MKFPSFKAGVLGLSTVLALAGTGIALTAAPAAAISPVIPCVGVKYACVGGHISSYEISAAQYRNTSTVWTNQASWKATTSASWITASYSGVGTTSADGTALTFLVQPNTTNAPRSGYVYVTAGTAAPYVFFINQAAGPVYTTAAPCVSAGVTPCVGGKLTSIHGSQEFFKSQNLIWSNQSSWTATTSDNWITLLASSSTGGTAIGGGTLSDAGTILYLNAMPNTTGYDRVGTVVVKAGSVAAPYTFYIFQAGPLGAKNTLEVGTGSYTAPATSAKYDAGVTTDAPGGWTASTTDSWLHLINTSGASGTDLSFTFDANTGPERVGTITVQAGTAAPVYFKVYQAAAGGPIPTPTPTAPAFLVLDQNEITIPAKAQLAWHMVGATTALTDVNAVTDSPNWLVPTGHISGRHVLFQAATNATGAPRVGQIFYTYNGETVTLKVIQPAS
jgi:hypothetical protein